MPASRGLPYRVPVSSYRLQFHGGFTLQHARALIPYVARLGITDCYASPLLAARAGSTHGYDICDHSRLNPEIGGDEDFVSFTDALASHGMGLILDFVPNHMGIHPAENKWWRDVLENGPSSPYARFFDIDWDPLLPELKGKVLLPILGDQYGTVLENGELQLSLRNGTLCLQYFDINLPVNPRYARVVFEHRLKLLEKDLGADDPHLREFLSILTALRNLPAYTETDANRIAERQREKEVARERLLKLLPSSPQIRQHVEENVRTFNGEPGHAGSYDRLHGLLEHQPYRLAYWRTALHEINYRRFFDINELAGLSMEHPDVFAETHQLVLEYIRQGRISGLRLDHVDGLFAPAQYFDRLQDAVSDVVGKESAEGEADPTHPHESTGAREEAARRKHVFYVVLEKILSGTETLRTEWSVDGTTGYDFLNDVNGLFVPPAHAPKMRRLYERFTGRSGRHADILYESKKLIMTTSLASELNVLANELHRISKGNRRSRDFTLDSLRDILREIVAAFPVYRTYVGAGGWSGDDSSVIETAVARARRRNPAVEPSIFDFVKEVLLPRPPKNGAAAEFQRRLRFAMKFQQFTGPVLAKGLEDTAFYRYVPLVSLNEVEGDLHRFGRPPAAFHEANLHRSRFWPSSMLATATHDTKRGEDARARLNVLSEIPDEWRKILSKWARSNAANRTAVAGQAAPDRNDEYLFYQALLGVWPPERVDRTPAGLVERLQQYMIKAVREAKTHTSWINPFEEYEQAVLQFVERALTGRTSKRFLESYLPFHQRLAHLGMLNSLAQLTLKLASPGVPDFYRGCELWDFSLVDPDNRRPIDFRRHQQLLGAIEPLLSEDLVSGASWPEREGSAALPSRPVSSATPGSERALHDSLPAGDRGDRAAELLRNWTDGRIKMYVTVAGLRLRRNWDGVFLRGEYIPLETQRNQSNHVVAFARRDGSRVVIAVVPRLVAALLGPANDLPIGLNIWGRTQIVLPEHLSDRTYSNVLTGERSEPHTLNGGSSLSVASTLRFLPVALLCSDA